MADKDDDDFEIVSAMADRLQLTGRDRDRYIHQHMTGLGYKMQPSYVTRDEEDDDDADDDRFFPRRRSGRDRTGRGDDERRPRGREKQSRGWYDD